MQTTEEIVLTVADDAGFLSPYSTAGKPVVSSEVSEFLDNDAKAIRPKNALRLKICGDCIDEIEKVKYAEAIKNSYEQKLAEEKRELKKKTITSAIFAVIGIIALIFMLASEKIGISEVWKECIDIFAWVFIWEAVDLFFIERAAISLRLKRYKNFARAEIVFCHTK